MIEISPGEVPEPQETGDNILLDSDGKIWIQCVVSDIDTDVGGGTRVTMSVTLTASNTSGSMSLVFPDESGGMVEAQAAVCISQYNMIFKYSLKG